MPNNFYRDQYVRLIGDAVSNARSVGPISHPGMKGKFREIIIENLLKPIFPEQFKFGNGKIVDSRGNESKEIDLILYSRMFLPPIMYGERDGVFPIESCFYALEIKSKATRNEIEDAYAKAKSIFQLVVPQSFRDGEGRVHFPVVPGLFCFDTDLTYMGDNDVKRYCDIDPDSKENPSIRFICIVGKGYWYFNPGKKEWVSYEPSADYEEVLSMISGISNTLLINYNNRRLNSFGYYLINDK